MDFIDNKYWVKFLETTMQTPNYYDACFGMFEIFFIFWRIWVILIDLIIGEHNVPPPGQPRNSQTSVRLWLKDH